MRSPLFHALRTKFAALGLAKEQIAVFSRLLADAPVFRASVMIRLFCFVNIHAGDRAVPSALCVAGYEYELWLEGNEVYKHFG